MLTGTEYIAAARVPERLKPQAFGLWTIRRVDIDRLPGSQEAHNFIKVKTGFPTYTLLYRFSLASLHHTYGEVVMEDSVSELRKHLPIWMRAKGRVLVTGMGLGCVVRGLLANPAVEHITVVEIDRHILRVVGHEFRFNQRVRLVHGNAFHVQLPGHFDYAWHDLWTEGDRHLQVLHVALLKRFYGQCDVQGAWELPRWFKHRMPKWVLR